MKGEPVHFLLSTFNNSSQHPYALTKGEIKQSHLHNLKKLCAVHVPKHGKRVKGRTFFFFSESKVQATCFVSLNRKCKVALSIGLIFGKQTWK